MRATVCSRSAPLQSMVYVCVCASVRQSLNIECIDISINVKHLSKVYAQATTVHNKSF